MKYFPQNNQQRGVAVITALLLTTLAITIVASLFWLQQVQVRSMENQRLHLQTKWLLRGALDMSRFLLREDFRHPRRAGLTTLDDLWAVPLEEVRLDEFIQNGRGDTEASDATMSGHIVDALSMYNLANLAEQGHVDPDEVEVFKRLLKNLKLDPALAQPAADAIAATFPLPDEPPDMQFAYVDDLLSVPGFTPNIVDSLKEFVIVIPGAQPVNVYTASAEVLSARIDTLTLPDAVAMVANRKRWLYKTADDFIAALPIKPTVALANKIDVKSNFFIANGTVHNNRAALEMRTLIYRNPDPNSNGPTTVIWIRED